MRLGGVESDTERVKGMLKDAAGLLEAKENLELLALVTMSKLLRNLGWLLIKTNHIIKMMVPRIRSQAQLENLKSWFF